MQTKQVVRSKQISERCERRMSERASAPLLLSGLMIVLDHSALVFCSESVTVMKSHLVSFVVVVVVETDGLNEMFKHFQMRSCISIREDVSFG